MLTADAQSPLRRKMKYNSTNASDPPDYRPIQSHIWYDDGNVVLQALFTRFKVNASVLSKASSFFKEILSFPESSETFFGESVDGCPLFHLDWKDLPEGYCEMAEDVCFILEALYEGKWTSFVETMPLAVCSAFLILGKKYNIQQLYLDAQIRLFRECYVTLDAFDASCDPYGWSAVCFEEYKDIVILARMTGLVSVLPYSFWSCCQETSDGIMQCGDLGIFLNLQDQIACMAGFRALCDAQAVTTYSWLRDTKACLAVECIQPERCLRARHEIRATCFCLEPEVRGFDDFDSGLSKGLCKPCVKVANTKHDEGRAELWKQLPSLFKLPPWSELLRERKVVYDEIIQSLEAQTDTGCSIHHWVSQVKRQVVIGVGLGETVESERADESKRDIDADELPELMSS